MTIETRLGSIVRTLGVARAFGALGLAVLLASVVGVSGAWANVPAWHISQMVLPAHLAPGGKGQLVATVSNLGDANATATASQPVEIAAQLPAGIVATGITTDFVQELIGYGHSSAKLSCELATLSCR
ncbi:MAG TPA: hypothetical protein VGY54_23665, partial [Polyangiaceae bacterium]|nr:hypothetical protein [Polyangiaceae bacterium]